MLKFLYLAYGAFSLVCVVLGINAIYAWLRGRPLTRWPYWGLAGVVGIALTYYFWGSSLEYPDAARHRLAALGTQTGPIGIAAVWPTREDGFFRGAELAVKHINDQGGVQVMGPGAKLTPRKLELKIVLESPGDVDRSTYAAVALNTGIQAVVGHASAAQAISASVAYNEAGVLYLASTISDPFLTVHGFPLVLRTISNDRTAMQGLAAACVRMNLRRVLVLKARDKYWMTLGRQFADALSTLALQNANATAEANATTETNATADANMTRVTALRSYPTDNPDIIALMSDISTLDFDAVMLADEYPRAARIIRAMRERGLRQPILGPHGLESQVLFQLADGWTSDVYILTNHAGQAATRKSTPLTTPFYEDYLKTYGRRPDAAATEAYEAIRVLAQGYAAAQTVNPAVVASKLRSRNDWQGLYGAIGFDHRGDATNRKLFLKRSADGTFVLADPRDIAN